MRLKHTSLVLLAALAIGGVVAGAASSATPSARNASVLIRHQQRGCHAWSVNGGAFKPTQSIALRHGSRLTVTNDDVMPHKLVLVSGPTLKFGPAMLGRPGATVKLTFSKPGVYRFTTKPGEDYVSGIKTIGEDNVLRMTVVVSK
jgi:plastocyanin